MPKSQARTAFGSKFYLSLVEADVLDVESQWGEVIAMKPPGDSWDTTEVTHFQSPDQVREHIKTLRDGGEADIQVNLVPGGATHLAMQASCNSPEAAFYSYLIPKSATTFWLIQGTCLVTGFDPETPLEDRMVATSRLKFTGTRVEGDEV